MKLGEADAGQASLSLKRQKTSRVLKQGAACPGVLNRNPIKHGGQNVKRKVRGD